MKIIRESNVSEVKKTQRRHWRLRGDSYVLKQMKKHGLMSLSDDDKQKIINFLVSDYSLDKKDIRFFPLKVVGGFMGDEGREETVEYTYDELRDLGIIGKGLYEDIRRKTPRTGKIEIDIDGPDGNAYALLAYARDFARQLGWSKEEWKALEARMKSGNYENLLREFDKAFGMIVDLVHSGRDEEEGEDEKDEELEECSGEKKMIKEDVSDDIAGEFEDKMEELKDIFYELQELVHQAFRGNVEEERAKYWISAIEMAISNEHSWLGRNMYTMQDTLEAMRNEGENQEE